VLLCGPGAQAGTLWNNGDFDGFDSITNQMSGLQSNTIAYDNFVVGAGTKWNITGVFSNDMLAAPYLPFAAHWEIRSGVSVGSGGTLIASGDAPASVVATGRSLNQYTEYKIEVDGLNVNLNPGTYWLSVTPDDPGYGAAFESYNSTTSGANAIGTPAGNDGNSFQTDPTISASFASISAFEGQRTDLSMGAIGTASPLSSSVPEPSAMTLLLLGAACFGRRVLARRHCSSGPALA
jgi:hypothetical protein